MNPEYILAIDQGTSGTKALVFNNKGKMLAKGSAPLNTNYFNEGWVEQDPEEIWQNVLQAVKSCLENFSSHGYDTSQIKSIGISNQRETFVVWDDTGSPLHPAIVWQCKRSIEVCQDLKKQGLEPAVIRKTGLLLDPYFSATKLIWLVQRNPDVKAALANGILKFGTIDSWLLYKMTHGAVHATDTTNASRTLLFNLKECNWDQELIQEFGLTGVQLPVVKPSSHSYGNTDLNGLLPFSVSVTALVGDSQAAAFGEGCFEPGTAKATLGTGCSVMMNIGSVPVSSEHGMVTTIAWSRGDEVVYGLEGVIVSCGATLEWLKNSLGLFASSAETAAMAKAVDNNGGVYLIPAFSGLGSPHWQMNRKASIHGLDFGSQKEHLVRAALESIAYQIKDVVEAMVKDAGKSFQGMKVDGGISANDFLVQFLADLLGSPVETIGMPDVSALGAAYLSGLESGIYSGLDELKSYAVASKSYLPTSATEACMKAYQDWCHWIRN
jgi:glycerol kinase